MTAEQLPPNTIVDSTGRKWRMIITAGIYATLRDEHGIDLLAEDALGDVMTDVIKRSEVLIEILDRQAVKHGLNSMDVDEILCDRETAPPAHVALEAALTDFYETQGQTVMAGVMSRVREAQRTLQSTAMSRINSAKMKEMIEKEIAKAETAMDQAMNQAMDQQERSESESGSQPSLPSPALTTGETSPLASFVDDIALSAPSDGITPPNSTPQSSPR